MGTSLRAAHLQQEAAVTVAVAAEALRLVVARVVPSRHEKVRHEAPAKRQVAWTRSSRCGGSGGGGGEMVTYEQAAPVQKPDIKAT